MTSPTTPRRRRTALLVATGFAVVGAAAACSPTATTPGATTAPTTGAATSYPSIAELDKALIAAGIPCQLEYEGLRDDVSKVELSICTIDAEQAFLRVWFDTGMLKQFVASTEGATGTVAVGANWTITVTSNATATKIAKALGGTVPTTAAPAK